MIDGATNATPGNFENINECMPPNKCNEHATCDDTVCSYTCNCLNGWTGDGESCADINECDDGSCNDGFNGDGFDFPDINECGNDPCGFNTVCISTHGAFECECAIGYKGDAMIGCSNIDGKVCEDVK